VRLRPLALLLVTSVLLASVACTNPLARQYEYDEQTYLDVDGSATVVLSASVASLVALRGLALDVTPDARFGSDDVRAVFEAAGCVVQRSSRPWRRDGRRFVQVRLEIADVRQAGACGPLAWSTYGFERTDTSMTFRQVVGAPTGTPPAGVSWSGAELVAFKLHLPSKVTFHNVRDLATNETGEVERGNILTWEQRLSDRLAGAPIDMHVVTDADSILYQTVFLFAGAFLAAVLVLIAVIWIVIRRGRARLREFRC
jgi:hypothetical protein